MNRVEWCAETLHKCTECWFVDACHIHRNIRRSLDEAVTEDAVLARASEAIAKAA